MFSLFSKATVAAATLFAGLVFTPVADAQDLQFLLWQKKVAETISANQRYPRSAVRKGIEGQAQIRLVVGANGQIKGYEVLKKTGRDVLDREIERLVSRINPLPAMPGEGKETVLTLPLVWRLQ